MLFELNTAAICSVVSDALKTATGKPRLSCEVTANSQMGNPKEWDSLSFVAVFAAIGEAFDVELEDDDAYHFQSISGIEGFLKEVLGL